MTVTVKKSRAEGRVAAPPSKSTAHRALICAALSSESVISGIAHSADIDATCDCLEKLGCDIFKSDGKTVVGKLIPESIPECEIYCNESGSTLRFLIPICLLGRNRVTLRGATRLMERPLSVYADICREKNLYLNQSSNGVTVQGPLKGGIYNVRGDISSQFITGLLFALPLCKEDSEIRISGDLESASYIDLTLKSLSDFGIKIVRGDRCFKIRGGQHYENRSFTVEGDWSNAAFLDALGIFGNGVEVTSLSSESLQGDRIYREHFAKLKNGFCEIDLSDCPDLAPIDFAVAAAFDGAKFIGTRRLKIKESDRAEAMRCELLKFGINVTVEENSVTVHKGTLKVPVSPIDGHNDHRIVMATTVLCTLTGGTVTGAEAVAKSFPDFFEKIESLGIGINYNET